LATVIARMLADGARTHGSAHGVILLSGPHDNDTVKLDAPVVNDTTTQAGRTWAWTLGQRYTTLEQLRAANRTSQL
jgi:hypothetical protein